ncbi:Prefoldin [Phlebopus sp. FC_14]|nr:Prefoldin [Phlebopus sp. FC_14]
MSLEARLQVASTEYQKLQANLATFVDKRTRLDAQLSENEMVMKEFTNISASNAIYKLIGPVLVPQNPSEAKNNVETRLEFIRGEINRIEVQIKNVEEDSEKKKNELVEIQTMLQKTIPGSTST